MQIQDLSREGLEVFDDMCMRINGKRSNTFMPVQLWKLKLAFWQKIHGLR